MQGGLDWPPCAISKLSDFDENQSSIKQFVEGQEVLRVLRNSTPLSHLLSRGLRGHMSCATGCFPPFGVFGFGLVGVWVFVSSVWFATCVVTPSYLDQGDLRRTCTHSASTRAKKRRLGTLSCDKTTMPICKSYLPAKLSIGWLVTSLEGPTRAAHHEVVEVRAHDRGDQGGICPWLGYRCHMEIHKK